MDEKTYVGHVADLASNQFHTELVPPADLDWMLFAAKGAGKWADAVKRALFYGAELQKTAAGAPTSLQHDPALAELIHGIIGLFTEAAELMEHLHDVLTGTAPLDHVNVVEEMGDVSWYLALLSKFTGVPLSQVRDINMAKLRKRFPEKFTEEQAALENRDLVAEREVLESELSIAGIARECHEVNLIYCQMLGDDSQVAWEDAPQWQRESAIAGVKAAINDPTITPAAMHRNWMQQKIDDGWVYGPVKDPLRKEHPCMVPYSHLPFNQQIKDYLFLVTVRRLEATLNAS